tara:strand:+ start:6397 stop:8103 length:1707 start_codon:yes stop_codon:yes gene_type:complete
MPIKVRVGQADAVKILSSAGGGSVEAFTAKNVIGGIASVTALDVTGISTFTGNINVSGISTFTSAIDANGSLDVDGHTELDNLNVAGVSTFNDDVFIRNPAGNTIIFRKEGDAVFDGSLDVSGISTYGGNVDINANVDVSGISTFTNTNINGDLNLKKTINTQYSPTTSSTPIVLIRNDASLNNSFAGLRLQAHNDNAAAAAFNISVINNSTDYKSTLIIQSRDGETDHSEKLRIADTGNIGIGITQPINPGHKTVHIHESVSSQPVRIHMTTVETGATASDGFSLSIDGNNKDVNLIQRESADMRFYTAGAEKVRITSDGEVGIGTTNPLADLQVGTGVTIYGNSGIVSATTFSGNANTASLSLFELVRNNSTANETVFPVFVDGDGNMTAQELEVDSGFTYNPSTGILSATTFKGSLSGDVTGDITGNISGNAGTATSLANARNIGGVGFDGSTNIDLPGVNISGDQNTSGTAGGLTGTPNINVGNIVAAASTFTGNVDIQGILTYEDVTNVDAVGLITARSGVRINTGGLIVSAGIATFGAIATFTDNVFVDGTLTAGSIDGGSF